MKSGVKIPEQVNTLLAYETGVHLGDGSLQIIPRGTYSVRYYGNQEEDWIFVSEILPEIIKQLYNKEVSAKKNILINAVWQSAQKQSQHLNIMCLVYQMETNYSLEVSQSLLNMIENF